MREPGRIQISQIYPATGARQALQLCAFWLFSAQKHAKIDPISFGNFGFTMFKRSVSFILWLAVLMLPCSLYYASFYAPSLSAPKYALLTFASASLGHFFLYFFIAGLLLFVPLLTLKKHISKWNFIYLWVVVVILQLILAVDAHVFTLYRFHLTWAMLDLFFNAGGEVIAFSAATYISIFTELCLLILYAAVAVGLSLFFASKRLRGPGFIAICCVVLYLCANFAHAYASAKGVLPITEIATRLPLYKPLTMNSMLIKMGVITKEELANRKITISEEGFFNYPKAPLACNPPAQKLNVLYLLVDALRADMLTPEIMPNTWEYARQAYRFTDSYSASNSTRGGIFGLFYGLPPAYWQVALASGIPAATIQAVNDSGYALGVFTTATVYKPEFNQTVFAGVPNLRVHSEGKDIFEKDANSIKDFMTFADGLNGRPFFSFIFLDNVHSAAVPEDAPHPFTPYLKTVNHMELNADTDREPYFNLYKNSAYYADGNVKKVLDYLKEKGLDKNTVVVITADHGEEFNDNGDNYWGHNSNFTKAQVQVPLVVKWPDMGWGVINSRTVSYDLSATILPRVFGVTNPLSDFTIGQDLFSLKPIDYFLAGSYLENAVIEEDRIVLIDKVGMLQFKNLDYTDSENTTRSPNLLKALQTFSEYLDKGE